MKTQKKKQVIADSKALEAFNKFAQSCDNVLEEAKQFTGLDPERARALTGFVFLYCFKAVQATL